MNVTKPSKFVPFIWFIFICFTFIYSLPLSLANYTTNYTTINSTIKEEVKCIFSYSNTTQKCYADDGKTICTGIGSCVATISGTKDQKILWRSSCSDEAFTTIISGTSKSVTFKCSDEKRVVKGYKYATWQCYNSDKYINKGDGIMCRTPESWYSDALSYCNSTCSSKDNKCGVNSFSLSNECELVITPLPTPITIENGSTNTSLPPTPFPTPIENVSTNTSTPITIENGSSDESISKNNSLSNISKLVNLFCENSCPYNNKCYTFGERLDGKYCSETGQFKEQLKKGEICKYNYECSSNKCDSGKCTGVGLVRAILRFFWLEQIIL